MSNDGIQVNEASGGVLRASVSSDAGGITPTPVTPEATRVYGSRNTTSAAMDAPAPGSGVMATARSAMGSGRIDKTTTVDVGGGLRTSLATAEAMGLIRRSASGSWEDAAGVTPATQAQQAAAHEAQQQEEQAAENAPQLFEPALEKEWAELIEPLPQSAYDAAIAGAANAVTDTSEAGWERVAKALSQATGMDPARAAEYVVDGYSVFEDQVATEMAKLGIDADEKERFYQFCQRPGNAADLTKATQVLTVGRRVDGFRALGVAYLTETNTAKLGQYRSMGYSNSYVDRKTGDLMLAKPGHNPVSLRELLKS